MKCPKCGAEANGTSAICGKCFTPLGHNAGPSARRAVQPRGRVMLLTGLALVIVACLAGWWFCLFNSSPVSMAIKATAAIHSAEQTGDTKELQSMVSSDSRPMVDWIGGQSVLSKALWGGRPAKFVVKGVRDANVTGGDASIDLDTETNVGSGTEHVHLVREGSFPVRRWKVDLKETHSFIGPGKAGGMSHEQFQRQWDRITEENRQMAERIRRASASRH